MSVRAVQSCPEWCHDHIELDEPTDGTSHRGKDAKIALQQHGPVSAFVERYDPPIGDTEYSVFLYPKSGLVQLSLAEARELNNTLTGLIAQADNDIRG